MKSIQRNGWWGLLFCLVTGSCSNFGPLENLGPLEHPEFTNARVSQLRPGMAETDVVELFGHPDERAIRTFGSSTDEPWSGLVYRYRFRDRKYKYIEAYKYNDIVFSLSSGEALLNHFNIEVIHQGEDSAISRSPASNPQKPSTEVARPDPAARMSSGTGLVVHPNGFIITAAHVVEGCTQLLVKLADGRILPATIVRQDFRNDVALIRVGESTNNYMPLTSARHVAIGERVFTVGFPVLSVLGQGPKFADGSVSSITGPGDTPSMLQVSVPLQPGNSGGPLVTDRGEVIGIVLATAALGRFVEETGSLPQNVNWALKADYVIPLLDGELYEASVSTRPAMTKLARSELLSSITNPS